MALAAIYTLQIGMLETALGQFSYVCDSVVKDELCVQLTMII